VPFFPNFLIDWRYLETKTKTEERGTQNVAVADGYELLTAHGILYRRKIDDSNNFFLTINAPAIMKVQEVIFLCGQNTLLGS